MRAFAEISDKTISSFIKLYESIPKGEKLLKLEVYRDGVGFFHPNYNDAVELINRGFFVQTCAFSGGGNLPIQGMLCDCTNAYYQYCKDAVAFVDK
jgi:hypothetical protein